MFLFALRPLEIKFARQSGLNELVELAYIIYVTDLEQHHCRAARAHFTLTPSGLNVL